MELYIISEDLFLINGLRSTLIFGLSLVKNILPIEALVKKYNAQSLLIIDTRVNLDKKFYSSLSKKEVAVIFFIDRNSVESPCFVYTDNSIHHEIFSIRNNLSSLFFKKLSVVFKHHIFTDMECKLLTFIFEGKSISDFCQKYKIKKNTYDTHISNILSKVGGGRILCLYKLKQVIYYDIMRISFALKPTKDKRQKAKGKRQKAKGKRSRYKKS
ncbi:response regulator transcription factor [Klebsiella quasipneumoniae]|uniref:response regulator transcription factor n=1 Tax=Klebsiella quasipneumoniae TaxID=1463165 RepID=UPI001867A555|nr:response regulator transcription factor [Klebsiella quasipneumoniae]